MKPSGIDWIGEIPAEWEIKKLRHTTKLRSESGYFSNGDIYIGLENIESSTGKYIQTETEYSDGFYDIVRKEDVLFGKLRPYLEKVYISDIDGFCTGEFLNFKKFEGDKHYLYYFLLSPYFIGNVNSSMYGAKMPRAEWDFIKNLMMPVPPSKEQQAIAAFLDTQCRRIDGIIAEMEQQIDILKQYKTSLITETVTKGLNKAAPMKDSGIDWIGKMPVHWEVKKLRYTTKLRSENGYFSDGNVYIGLENIESSTGRYIQTETEYSDGFYDIVRKGDVLFGKLRPYLEKVYISDIDGFCTGEFLNFKEFEGDKHYLYYFLLSSYFIETVNSSTYGTKMPRAEWDFIKNLMMPIPPLKEQQAVVTYLDKKCSKIADIITIKRQSIETMKAYKKSLIYEYVTGKKRVKGYQWYSL